MDEIEAPTRLHVDLTALVQVNEEELRVLEKFLCTDEDAEQIGAVVRALRNNMNMTLQDVSERLREISSDDRVSASYLSQLERGKKKRVSFFRICRLAQCFNTTAVRIAWEASRITQLSKAVC